MSETSGQATGARPQRKDEAARSRRARLPRTVRKIAGYAFAVAVLLLGWHLTALVVDSPALPTPLATIPVFLEFAPDLLPQFWVSLYRIVAALAIACVLAAPLGLALGRLRRLDAWVAPVLYLAYPIPKIVLLPVLLVLFGLGDGPKVALIALTLFFQILVSMRDATRLVPEEAILSARSLGAGRWGLYRHVILPAVLPELFTALRVGSGIAVAILFLAEAIAGSTGLGYFIVDAWGMIDYPRMFAGIIAMAILGVLIYEALEIAETRLTRWRRAGRRSSRDTR